MKLKRIDATDTSAITFSFDDQTIRAASGDTVAAALLAAGITSLRHTQSQRARAPWCMMGACYDCLVQIDGVTVQACMTLARDGLTVARVSPQVAAE